MLIFVVDIDGTVADTRERIDSTCRVYGRQEWEWTNEEVLDFLSPDKIKKDRLLPGAEILPELARRCGAKIVFFTGRSEIARRSTRIWLANKLDIYDTVPLVMRPKGDPRSTADCKIDVFKTTILQVFQEARFVFFEDDEELLLHYSKLGLALKCPDAWNVIKFAKEL